MTDPPMAGADVKALQLAIKRRLKARGLADDIPVGKHGKFTQATWFAFVEAGYVLGLREDTYLRTELGQGVATKGAQRVIRDPDQRSAAQRARATERRGRGGPRYLGALGGRGKKRSVAAPLRKILGDSNGWTASHDGIDLISEAEATLHAICDAVVIDVRAAGWWGKGARASGGHTVSDGDGIIQLRCAVDAGPFRRGLHIGYGHAEGAVVAVGQTVQAGQKIGHAGFANAWHVHLMVNGGGHLRGIGDRDPLLFVRYALRHGRR